MNAKVPNAETQAAIVESRLTMSRMLAAGTDVPLSDDERRLLLRAVHSILSNDDKRYSPGLRTSLLKIIKKFEGNDKELIVRDNGKIQQQQQRLSTHGGTDSGRDTPEDNL